MERVGMCWVLASALFGAGCASSLSQYDQDRGVAAEVLELRASSAPDLDEADEGALSPLVLELLAQGLDEERAVRIALLNNRAVRATFAELGVSAAATAQAGRIANPAFSGDAKFFSGGTEIELSLVQPILAAMLLPLRRDLAEAQYEEAKARTANELVGLVHEVRRALVRVRAAERQVELARDALVAAEASRELMAELHKAGNITDPRLSGEQVGLSRARLDLAAAQAAAYEAREPLNVLLGLWGEAVVWKPAGELADEVLTGLELEEVEGRAVAASLALAANRASAEAHARSAGIVEWETFLPGAGLGVAAKREASDGSWGLGPALGFELPLFDRGDARRQAELRALEASLARHVTLAVELRSAARLLRERVVTLGQRVHYLREQHLPAYELLVRHTLRDYNAMQVGAFDVLEVRQLQLEAAREYVDTLRAAWLARIDLEELLEGRLAPERASAGHSGAGAPRRPQPGKHRP